MGNCITKSGAFANNVVGDMDGDGDVDAQDYALKADAAVNVLSGLATTTTVIMEALNTHPGIDTTAALAVMEPIKNGFAIADITTDIALDLPKSVEDIKDMDGDGDIDAYDLVLMATDNVDNAQRILVELRRSGADLGDVEKVFDALKLITNALRDTVPPPPPKKAITIAFNTAKAEKAEKAEVAEKVEKAVETKASNTSKKSSRNKVKAKKIS